MDADHGKPVFTLHFNGTTTTRTVAVKPPVKAFNTGLGGFDVHREIRFDGSQFSEGPASIEATYRSKLDRLATPPRLRGWIVRRFAGPQIEKTRPQADAIALADTKATILKEFEEHTDRLVDDLNGNVPWKQTIALLVPQDAGWVSHFDNTEDWIVTSPGPEGAAVPELPEEAAELKAPLELWVHGKPNEMSATKLIVLWSTAHVGLNRFREVAPANVVQAAENLKPTVEETGGCCGWGRTSLSSSSTDCAKTNLPARADRGEHQDGGADPCSYAVHRTGNAGGSAIGRAIFCHLLRNGNAATTAAARSRRLLA